MAVSKHGRGADQVSLRLPDGLRDRIKAEADRNGRSMNAEIVARLEGVSSVDAAGYTRLYLPQDLLERIDAYATSIATIPETVIRQTLEKNFPYTPTFAEYLAGVREAVEDGGEFNSTTKEFFSKIEEFLRDNPDLGKRRTDLHERPYSFWADE